jgi:hypothetical protein
MIYDIRFADSGVSNSGDKAWGIYISYIEFDPGLRAESDRLYYKFEKYIENKIPFFCLLSV